MVAFRYCSDHPDDGEGDASPVRHSIREVDLPLFRRLCGVGNDQYVPLGEQRFRLDGIAALNLLASGAGRCPKEHHVGKMGERKNNRKPLECSDAAWLRGMQWREFPPEVYLCDAEAAGLRHIATHQ